MKLKIPRLTASLQAEIFGIIRRETASALARTNHPEADRILPSMSATPLSATGGLKIRFRGHQMRDAEFGTLKQAPTPLLEDIKRAARPKIQSAIAAHFTNLK